MAQADCHQSAGAAAGKRCLIPQDMDYPGLQLNVNREKAAFLGLTEKDVVDGVITALTSNGMIAPSYWVDPKTGNNYMLTVQYYNSQIQSLQDFKQIPLRAEHSVAYVPPGSAERPARRAAA